MPCKCLATDHAVARQRNGRQPAPWCLCHVHALPPRRCRGRRRTSVLSPHLRSIDAVAPGPRRRRRDVLLFGHHAPCSPHRACASAARVPRGIDAFGRSPRRATSKPRDRSSSSARTSPRTSSLCSSATSGNVRAASQRLPQAHRVTAIGSLLSIRWVQEMGVSAGMPCTAQGACVAYVCEVLVHPVHPSGHQERRQRRNSPLVRACTATVSAALNAVLRVLGRWCACCDAAPARSTLSGYRAAHLLRPVLRTAPVRAGAVRDPGPCLDAHRAHCGYRPRLRGNVRAWTVLWDLGPVVRAASRR